VFATNLAPQLIDRAFLRPGRIDAVLPFPKPDAGLRRQLIDRWHPDVLAGIDATRAVAETDGTSFAEVEELNNLKVLRYVEAGVWDWDWATAEFRAVREEAVVTRTRPVGFADNGTTT
jgi:ATP-dependent 26S proteasome regulatory subunit